MCLRCLRAVGPKAVYGGPFNPRAKPVEPWSARTALRSWVLLVPCGVCPVCRGLVQVVQAEGCHPDPVNLGILFWFLPPSASLSTASPFSYPSGAWRCHF